MPTSPHILEPGDPGFDWSRYNAWKQSNPDPVAGAEDFLARNGSPVTQAMIDAPATPSGPQLGERRAGASETVEWNGSRWTPVDSATATGANGDLSSPGDTSPTSVLTRFLGGALKTSPLNPMNLVSAVAHPIATAGSIVATPLRNAVKAIGDASDVVTGGANNDRVLAAAQLGRHALGAIPLVGEPLAVAGENIGKGDVAGCLGQIGGVASGALVPDVPGAVGAAADTIGRGAERVGTALIDKPAFSGMTVPGLGMAESALRADPRGLAVAVAPYGLKYGGKGLQTLGSALNGLQDSIDTYRGSGAAVAMPDEAPAAAHMDLSTPVRAGSLTPEQMAERFAAAKANPGAVTLASTRGRVYQDRPTGGSVPASKLDTALSGLQTAKPAPVDAVPIADETPAFTYEPANPDIPSLSTGSTGPVSTLPPAPSINDLRKQWSSATDPAERAFLARAINQRYRVQRVVSGLAGR